MAGRSDSGDGLLLSRVHDAFRIARDSCVVKHIGFLDEHGAALCASALKGQNEVDVRFFGGHEDAERTVLGLFPKGEEIRWPIAALTLLTWQEASLSHRDYLGSMLALGIARESVGDLLCEPGRCVAFLMPSVVPVIRDELTRIGREGVRIAEGYEEPLPAAHTFRAFTETVASLRLDGVVAALCSVSRGQATEWIRLGLVSCNGRPCDKTSAAVREGDKIAVRGKGKFVIDRGSAVTRKGRIVLEARQYL